MGFTQSISSIGLGGIIAWLILTFFQAKKTVSYYTQLRPMPLEEDTSNLALIGVGLASAKPSVMDATPSAQPQVMIMEQPPQMMMEEAPSPLPAMSPEVVNIAVPAQVAVPLAVAPSPMAMSMSPMGSPVTLTPGPSPSA
jgi:hypothetical protein